MITDVALPIFTNVLKKKSELKFRGEGEVKSEVLISENGTGEKHHLFLLKTLQVFIFLSYFLECPQYNGYHINFCNRQEDTHTE